VLSSSGAGRGLNHALGCEGGEGTQDDLLESAGEPDDLVRARTGVYLDDVEHAALGS